MKFKTLNLALISLSFLSTGLMASSQPVNFEASDVVKPGSTFSSSDTSAFIRSIDEAKVKTQFHNFKSPPYRQPFAVQLDTKIIKTASWTFDVFVEVYNGLANIRVKRPIQTNEEITQGDLSLPYLKVDKADATTVSGTATFVLTGYVKKIHQKLEVTMKVEFSASEKETHFIQPVDAQVLLDRRPFPIG